MYLLTKENIIILTKHATDKELREGTKIEASDVLVDFETHLVFKLNNALELKFKGEMCLLFRKLLEKNECEAQIRKLKIENILDIKN